MDLWRGVLSLQGADAVEGIEEGDVSCVADEVVETSASDLGSFRSSGLLNVRSCSPKPLY